MKQLRKIGFALFPLVLVGLLVAGAALGAQSSLLDTISQRGYIRVGTTGDYKPFSFLDSASGKFEGHDIDVALKIGKALGVEVRFVKTTWKTLVQGILDVKYDIAMSGITRNLLRQKQVGLTTPYIQVGKSPLIRKSDRGRFKTLADIDQPGVKVAVNPGGTNERFVKAHIQKAEILIIAKNLDIPAQIADSKADVMITDNVEAMLIASRNPKLWAVAPDKPFTRDDFGYMVPRDDQAFLNWMNLFVHQMKMRGEFEQLKKKWIAD